MNLLVRKLAGGMCWFCVCAALYDKICVEIRSQDRTSNWQFAKVPYFFLIVKIITVFELVRGHTKFTQSMDLTHQN